MTANPNPSLQKKSAARTAAVQALYRIALTGEKSSIEKQVAQLKKQLENNRDEQKLQFGIALEPNYPLVEKILTGLQEFEPDINAMLDRELEKDWTRERMGPLLTALLQCAIFELFFYKDTKPNIVIDEYTRMARSFLPDNEVGFVHGLLHKLSQKTHG